MDFVCVDREQENSCLGPIKEHLIGDHTGCDCDLHVASVSGIQEAVFSTS